MRRFTTHLGGCALSMLACGVFTSCGSPEKSNTADTQSSDPPSVTNTPTPPGEPSSTTPPTPPGEPSTTTPVAPPASTGLVEPGTPTVLASNLVYGSRLCFGNNDLLYFPNRIGYPLTPGQEELWSVSRAGGQAQRILVPGSVTGCAQAGDVLWLPRNTDNFLTRLNTATGVILDTFFTTGTPIQVAANATQVFASTTGVAGGAVVLIDPAALAPAQILWNKPGSTVPLWLDVNAERLVFSASDVGQDPPQSWIVRIQLPSLQGAELVTSTGEIGSVDTVDDVVYYAHHNPGTVHRFDVSSGVDTVMAELPDAWSVRVDGDYLYVAARPDYCQSGEGQLYRVALADSSVTLLADRLNCPSQMLVDARGLYWINSGTWQGPDTNTAAPNDGSVGFLPRH